MSEEWTICDECSWPIEAGDEALMLFDGSIVHEHCAEDMLANGDITQQEFDDATPYDLVEQASYREQYRHPWSW